MQADLTYPFVQRLIHLFQLLFIETDTFCHRLILLFFKLSVPRIMVSNLLLRVFQHFLQLFRASLVVFDDGVALQTTPKLSEPKTQIKSLCHENKAFQLTSMVRCAKNEKKGGKLSEGCVEYDHPTGILTYNGFPFPLPFLSGSKVN